MQPSSTFNRLAHGLALGAILLYFGWHALGHAIPIGLSGPMSDGLTQAIPKLVFYADELKAGRMPTWDPWSGTGAADFVVRSHVMYPTTWITARLLPPWLAVLFDQCANFLLLYAFAFYLLRKSKAPEFAAAAGALVLAFGGLNFRYVFYPYFSQTAAWVPLVFIAIEGLFNPNRSRFRMITLGAAAVGFMLLAGMLNYLVYTLLFGGLYALLLAKAAKSEGPGTTRRAVWGLVFCLAFVALGFGLGASRLLPLLEQADRLRSGYGQWEAFRGLLVTPMQWIANLAPGSFGQVKRPLVSAALSYGLSVWALAFAFLFFGRKTRGDRFWAAVMVCGLATCIDSPLTHALFVWMPGFERFEPTRIWAVAGVALVWLCCRALWQLTDESVGSRILWGAFALAGLQLIWLVVFALVNPVSNPGHLLPAFVGAIGIAVVALGRGRIRLDWHIALVSVVIALEVFSRAGVSSERIDTRVHYKMTPIIRTLTTAEKPFRVIRLGDRWNWWRDGRLYTQEALKYNGIEDLHAYSSMIDPNLLALIDGFRSRTDFELNPFDQKAGIQPFLTDAPIQNRFADWINARFVLSQYQLPNNGSLVLAATSGGLYLYKNPYAWPRAFLVYSARFFPDIPACIDSVHSSFSPGEEVFLVGTDPDWQAPAEPTFSKVEPLERTPVSQRYLVKTDQPAYLVVTDLFDENWHAWIRNDPAPVLRANGAFRAVFVPQGDTLVTFAYRPKAFLRGRAASLAALGILTAMFIAGLFVNRKRSARGAG